MMNRDIRPTDKGSIGIPSLGRTEASRKGSSGSLAPPAAFKAPLPPVQARPRSGVPTEVPSLAPPYGNASPSASRRHRYRVSMHEAGFRPTLASEFSESPPQILSPPEESDALPSSGRSKAAAFGLGLQLPSIPVHMASSSASGSMTPGAPANQPRMRSTTGQGLQMDLAGISSLGDAASHASMIMQSRQAKLQRWRPSSAGYQASPNKPKTTRQADRVLSRAMVALMLPCLQLSVDPQLQARRLCWWNPALSGKHSGVSKRNLSPLRHLPVKTCPLSLCFETGSGFKPYRKTYRWTTLRV